MTVAVRGDSARTNSTRPRSGVVGQVDVCDHQLEVLGRAEGPGGVRVLRDLAAVAGSFQHLQQHRLRAGLGVDDQDSFVISA